MHKKIIFTLIMTSVTYFFPTLHAIVGEFKVILSFNETQHIFNQAIEETKKNPLEQWLFVFDFDDTLIADAITALQTQYEDEEAYKNFIKKKNLLPHQKHQTIEIALVKAPSLLIEPNIIVKQIQKLQETKINVIGLTSSLTGAYGTINKLEKHRYEKLKSLGIDFSKNFFPWKSCDFDAFPAQTNENSRIAPKYYPRFYKGITFTRHFNKGDVLKKLLIKANFKPKHIVFFDNDYDIVSNFGNVIDQWNKDIQIYTYWYLGASSLLKKPFNKKVAEIQFNELLSSCNLLTDDEAEKVLEEQQKIIEKK